jgi:SRSO17 transposase
VRASALAASLPVTSFHEVTWRQGSKGTMTSRFAAAQVRPANRNIPREADGTLPARWLLIEWPADEDKPTDYRISTLPADTPIAELVRLGKIRWRIEHDYRELKHGLGLDHFEGRTWPGWHHHVTLVSAAHLFVTTQRLTADPKVRGAA